MRDQHDGLARNLVNARDLQLQRGARHRVQRAKRLVHQQHFGVARQRPRHPDSLLLSAGKLVRVACPVHRWFELQQCHQLGNARVNADLRPVQQRGYGGNVFFDAPVRKQANRLDGITHAAADVHGPETANFLARKKDAAAIVFHQPVHHLEQGGLARTRAAQNDNELTLCNVQGQPVDDLDAVKAF